MAKPKGIRPLFFPPFFFPAQGEELAVVERPVPFSAPRNDGRMRRDRDLFPFFPFPFPPFDRDQVLFFFHLVEGLLSPCNWSCNRKFFFFFPFFSLKSWSVSLQRRRPVLLPFRSPRPRGPPAVTQHLPLPPLRARRRLRWDLSRSTRAFLFLFAADPGRRRIFFLSPFSFFPFGRNAKGRGPLSVSERACVPPRGHGHPFLPLLSPFSASE